MHTNLNKINTILVLMAALLVAAALQGINIISAQTEVATVIVMPTTGGTTNPAPGQYTYNNGTNIVLTAVPDTGYVFSYWIISGDLFPGHTISQTQPTTIVDPDTGQIVAIFPKPGSPSPVDSLTFTTNPTNITCGYGYSYVYTAIFAPVSQPSPTPGQLDAVVIVMPTTGGTVSPAAGMYTYSNGSVITISAIPDSGYKFNYWIVSSNYTPGHGTLGNSIITDESGQVIGVAPRADVSGIDSATFTANPAKITCGYGYTYTYTAFFSKVSATSSPTLTTQPTASTNPTATPAPITGSDLTLWVIAALVVIIIIIVIVAAVLMRRKK